MAVGGVLSPGRESLQEAAEALLAFGKVANMEQKVRVPSKGFYPRC